MEHFYVVEIDPGFVVTPIVENAKPVYLNVDNNSINKILLKAKAIEDHYYPKIKFVSPISDKVVNITICKDNEVYGIGDYEINYDLKNFVLFPLNFDPGYEPIRENTPCIIDRNTNRVIDIKTVRDGYLWLINKT